MLKLLTIIFTRSIFAMAGELACSISTSGAVFWGIGADGICCISLPALGGCAANAAWLITSSKYGKDFLYSIKHQLSEHTRSEEHTSELQSLTNLVCRLLLE